MAPTPLSASAAFEHLSLLATRDVSDKTVMNRKVIIFGICGFFATAILLFVFAKVYRCIKGTKADNGH